MSIEGYVNKHRYYGMNVDAATEEKPVFRNCNVCGRELIRKDELAIGMCAICANEEVDETSQT